MRKKIIVMFLLVILAGGISCRRSDSRASKGKNSEIKPVNELLSAQEDPPKPPVEAELQRVTDPDLPVSELLRKEEERPERIQPFILSENTESEP